MPWEIEYTDEFESWWNSLSEDEQISIAHHVEILEGRGPSLGRPYVDTIRDSKHANMKELRVQHEGRPYRVFFAFDPFRTGILLIGGDKTGRAQFYVEMVPIADAIYSRYLAEGKE